MECVEVFCSRFEGLLAVVKYHERKYGTGGDGITLVTRGADGLSSNPAVWTLLATWPNMSNLVLLEDRQLEFSSAEVARVLRSPQ